MFSVLPDISAAISIPKFTTFGSNNVGYSLIYSKDGDFEAKIHYEPGPDYTLESADQAVMDIRYRQACSEPV